MQKLLKQYGLVLWLSIILIAGFAFTSFAGYFVSRDAIHQSVAEQTLPISSDNIDSEIHHDLQVPLKIAAHFAEDKLAKSG